MAVESIHGRMVEHFMVSGFKMTWKVLVFIYGAMVAAMRASITMTKSVVLVSIIGLMAVATRAGGIRASNTD
jgi:hypothetical protein